MDCSLKTGITIESGSSSAAGVPDDTFVSISTLTIQSAASIRSGPSLLPHPDLAVLQIPAPRCAQTSFKIRRSIITEFARRFGGITPTRVNFTAAASFVVNPDIASGNLLERCDERAERCRLSAAELVNAGELPLKRCFDAAHQIADVKVIALLGAVAVDDERLLANNAFDEGGYHALFVRRARTVNVRKAQRHAWKSIGSGKGRAIALHSKLGGAVGREWTRCHLFRDRRRYFAKQGATGRSIDDATNICGAGQFEQLE